MTIWFLVDHGIDGETVRWPIWVLTVSLGVLMFSKVRYYSFKTFPLAEKVPLVWIFLLVLVIALLTLDPPTVLMLVGFIYVIAGIVMTLVGRRKRQARRKSRSRQRQSPRIDGGEGRKDGGDGS